MLSFEEFKKVDLRVGRVLAAEKIEGSDKLLKLEVSLGDEMRQIVAGIGKSHEAKNLAGKEIIVVANLEVRTLMGFESQGMLLAADSGEDPVILVPEKEVPPGTNIR